MNMICKWKHFAVLSISTALMFTGVLGFSSYASETEMSVEGVMELESENATERCESKETMEMERDEIEADVQSEIEIKENNSETDALVVDVETDIPETETEEDNPISEITEHGIVITKSCAEAIEKKLIWHGYGNVVQYNPLHVHTSVFVDPMEFWQLEYVTAIESSVYEEYDYYSYSLWFDVGLTLRERAALIAEDSRVTEMEFSTGVLITDPGWSDPAPIPVVFIDNKPGDYYYVALQWASSSFIAKGYSGNLFGVGETCSRKDFIVFLWRMLGSPHSGNYRDLSKYYNDLQAYDRNTSRTDTYKALSWAVSNGIAKGYKDGGFHPNETVTRKDALIFMYRALKPGVPSGGNFDDVIKMGYSEDSDSYRAISWAAEKQIAKGYADGLFHPKEKCLREQAITFLYRASLQRFPVQNP